ncbi:cysteine hydrolase family protein [filamentous cyanobacterium LEGE 11480]|uniref:Cysteine hydrolase family protein n=1 Tax=Romeriopsis navalis LEGE 11480 TaxID=2777977 RepID=A0A928VQV7_9CYAN|nr:cysteine hydrolase family protein [Romeriopsis navalis]MBE9032123.1 cysteine hydrolase family protein [Romeriopsis navalis LEGE 11480]
MDPSKTALILIGYQNDYFSPDGVLYSVIEASTKSNQVLENTVHLLSELVKTPTLMVATPIFFTPNYDELTEAVGILKTIKEVRAFQANTAGAATIEQLKPFEENILEVPGKRGFNAFINTNLDNILRKRGINHIMLAGAVASVCIDSTGRYAHERGYQVSILRDCLSARTIFEQEFYCDTIFPLYADVIDHNTLLENLLVPA